ncbi:MAG: hypothetical protein LM557_04755 [Desulfurococcaceae archaeon]|jgi:hypothetical protein|nr:hypothetical protein [Desulfurococcaceae archaeon]
MAKTSEVYSYIIKGVSKLQQFLLLWVILGIVSAVLIIIALLPIFLVASGQFSANTALLITLVIIVAGLLIGLIPYFIYMIGVKELSKWRSSFSKYKQVVIAVIILAVVNILLTLNEWVYAYGVLVEVIAAGKISPENLTEAAYYISEVFKNYCAERPLLCLIEPLIDPLIIVLSIVLVGVFSTARREVEELTVTATLADKQSLLELKKLSTATLLLRTSLLFRLLNMVMGLPFLTLPSWLVTVIEQLSPLLSVLSFVLLIVGVILGYTGLSRVKSIIAAISVSEKPGAVPIPV